jgi:hypothetical protein
MAGEKGKIGVENSTSDGIVVSSASKSDRYSTADSYYILSDRAIDYRQRLQPLLRRLRQYDLQRVKLESAGGALGDFDHLTKTLNSTFTLKGRYRDYKVSLAEQDELAHALNQIGNFDLHMNIRMLDTGMPVYYICRVERDYWMEYSLIVEDLYRSPSYNWQDERFAKLMYMGHEYYFLRLSLFRNRLSESLSDRETGQPDRREVDEFIYSLGRHIFQAAWHEDQRPGMLTAEHFGLTKFHNAIELLYLCLSGELCQLRSSIDDRFLNFFEKTYPQPAIHSFLKRLVKLQGSELDEIPKNTLPLYARLIGAFSEFLEVGVIWGIENVELPLYKLIFSNFSRLDLVSAKLRENPDIVAAAGKLESTSQEVIGKIVRARRRKSRIPI